MDYLTVKELAELKGCSEQYAKRIVKDGKINAEMQINPETKKMRYMIPISTLPEDLKVKYYNNLKKEAGTAPELIESETLKPPIIIDATLRLHSLPFRLLKDDLKSIPKPSVMKWRHGSEYLTNGES